MRAIAWERRQVAGKFLFASCPCPDGTPETPARGYGSWGGDVKGFVYAGCFPAGNAIKIGSTSKSWIRHRVDQFRVFGGVPKVLDVPVRERFYLLAAVPCGLFRDAESAVIRAICSGNKQLDGPEWCAANTRGEWHEGGRVSRSRKSEYFHETPSAIEAVSVLRRAMQVCIERRSAWMHRGAATFEELRASIGLIGKPLPKNLRSSA